MVQVEGVTDCIFPQRERGRLPRMFFEAREIHRASCNSPAEVEVEVEVEARLCLWMLPPRLKESGLPPPPLRRFILQA